MCLEEVMLMMSLEIFGLGKLKRGNGNKLNPMTVVHNQKYIYPNIEKKRGHLSIPR
jgi:hypothetical protein